MLPRLLSWPSRSTLSQYSSEKGSLALVSISLLLSTLRRLPPRLQLDRPTRGTTRVKYQADSDWDYSVDGRNTAIDLSLILPHYRARHQPVDHRMSMFIGCDSEPIKVKVVSTARLVITITCPVHWKQCYWYGDGDGGTALTD